MKHWVACLLAVSLLSGCAGTGEHLPLATIAQRGGACPSLSADQELVLSLSAELIAEGRLHAALANLESVPGDLPEVRLRKARILRLLADPRAEPLYSGLLGGCLNAQAHHGLGQIAAARGNYPEARGYLDVAAKLSPTDAAVRNDLGLVLLHLRQLNQARFELLTALELDQAGAQPLDNLLTLLLYQDQWQEAAELVRRRGLSPQQFQAAEERSRALKQEDLARAYGDTSPPAQVEDASWIKVRPATAVP